MDRFDIFLMTQPGLEQPLVEEARDAGFSDPRPVPGGVVFQGTWHHVWKANLVLRGAGRVQASIGEFRAFHLAQLDKRARKFPWLDIFRPDVPIQVEVTTRKSKIYHAGAAKQRIETALVEGAGLTVAERADVTLRARIDDNLVAFSVDTSGAPLHKRGSKQAMGKAPMRENMAAMFLRACGYTGTEPVLDPMCGSGTFVLEAAEIAAGLLPGRGRPFAFETLATFDPDAWASLRQSAEADAKRPAAPFHCYGSDRDAGAFAAARANAERAGIGDMCQFEKRPVSEISPPEGGPGLVIVNPPYGTRIGDRKPLFGLYAALGNRLAEAFSGWRVGIVTSDGGLARATDLPFHPDGPPIAHGGLKVRLYQTDPLP